jgi:hypothetical protein
MELRVHEDARAILHQQQVLPGFQFELVNGEWNIAELVASCECD